VAALAVANTMLAAMRLRRWSRGVLRAIGLASWSNAPRLAFEFQLIPEVGRALMSSGSVKSKGSKKRLRSWSASWNFPSTNHEPNGQQADSN